MTDYININPEWEIKYPDFYNTIKSYTNPLDQVHRYYVQSAMGGGRLSSTTKIKLAIELQYPASTILQYIQEILATNHGPKNWIYEIPCKEEQLEQYAKAWIIALNEKVKNGAKFNSLRPSSLTLNWLLSFENDDIRNQHIVKPLMECYKTLTATQKPYIEKMFKENSVTESTFLFNNKLDASMKALDAKIVASWRNSTIEKSIADLSHAMDLERIEKFFELIKNQEDGITKLGHLKSYIESSFTWKKKAPRELEVIHIDAVKKLMSIFQVIDHLPQWKSALIEVAQHWKNDPRFFDMLDRLNSSSHTNELATDICKWMHNYGVMNITETVQRLQPQWNVHNVNWFTQHEQEENVREHSVHIWKTLSTIERDGLIEAANSFSQLKTFPPKNIPQETITAIHKRLMDRKNPYKIPSILYHSVSEMPLIEKIQFFLSFANESEVKNRQKGFQYAKETNTKYMPMFIQNTKITAGGTYNSFYRHPNYNLLPHSYAVLMQWMPEKKHELLEMAVQLDNTGLINQSPTLQWVSKSLFGKEINLENVWERIYQLMVNDLPIDIDQMTMDYVLQELDMAPTSLSIDNLEF